MYFRLSGNCIFGKIQSLNACADIPFKVLESVTLSKEEQPLNADCQMCSTPSGIVTDVILGSPLQSPAKTCCIFSPNETSVIFEHPLK